MHKLLAIHADKGYAIISACRSDKSESENNENTKRLQANIVQKRYFHKIVRGGFIENKGTQTEREVTEDAFVVFSIDKYGAIRFDVLETFVVEMCSKYSQDRVLVARPDENPAYVTADGGVELELGVHDSIEQNIVDYFTRLENDSISFSGIKDSEPKTINGMHVREMRGEVMKDKNGHRYYGR